MAPKRLKPTKPPKPKKAQKTDKKEDDSAPTENDDDQCSDVSMDTVKTEETVDSEPRGNSDRSDQQREYERLRKRAYREKQKALKSATQPEKKKIKDMSKAERKEYDRRMREERKLKKEVLTNEDPKKKPREMKVAERKEHEKKLRIAREIKNKDLPTTSEPKKKFREMNQAEKSQYRSQLKAKKQLESESLADDISIIREDCDDVKTEDDSVEPGKPKKNAKRSKKLSPDSIEEFKVPHPKRRQPKKTDQKSRSSSVNSNQSMRSIEDEAHEEDSIPASASISDPASVSPYALASAAAAAAASAAALQRRDPEPPKLGQKRNCKVRLGLIELIDVETEAIVIPHYDLPVKSDDFKQLLKKLDQLKVGQSQRCQELIESTEVADTFKNFGSVTFEWEGDQNSRNFELKKSIHVAPPTLKKEDSLKVFSEAHLRASYLSCLLEADKNNFQSLAFPILSFEGSNVRSVLIGLQTIFAYMHSVNTTCLQLVYIVTPYMDVYDLVGEAFSYVREFDLSLWTTEKYLKYEEKIFERVEYEYGYVTIPGTDMIWRAFTSSYGTTKYENNREKTLKLHELMCHQTSVEREKFTVHRKAYGTKFLAKKRIENGVTEGMEDGAANILDIRFDLQNFCGSNKILRKLWIISYYHMYFEEHSGDEVDVDLSSAQCVQRKQRFEDLRMMHTRVVEIWNYTLKNAPFQCDCAKYVNYHIKMMVFMTNLSCPDVVMDKWILGTRSFVFNDEHNNNFLRDYAQYEPQFVYRTQNDRKLVAVRGEQELQRKIETSLNTWLPDRLQVFAQQQATLLRILHSEMKIANDADVGSEASPEFYNPEESDEMLDDIYKNRITEKERQAAQRTGDELKNALEELENYKIGLPLARYTRHFEKDLDIEQTLRNRYFRLKCSIIIGTSYPRDEDEDDQQDQFDDTEIWKKDKDSMATVDEYIDGKLRKLRIERFNPSTDAVPYDLDRRSTIRLYPSRASRNSSTTDREKYPEPLKIGGQNVECPYCGALSFETERSWSCCKSGAVWIPPIKRVPKEIQPIFQKKFRSLLIAANAAFSMASIAYTRQTQAKGGIQSLKIKGLISCHPSAINPRNEKKPAYANFIVLNCSDKKIAGKRFERMSRVNATQKKELKKIFVGIQTYMNKFNRLYESYKSMAQLEKEFKKLNVPENRIKFRIVPPTELDRDQVAALQAHKGVYARPSQMENGYVSVAYTMDIEKDIPRTRGYEIYSKNPKDPNTPQQPLSGYSDFCELMSYPFFFPDAIGGWGLHKYPRIEKKDRSKVLYVDRVKSHIAELQEFGQNPAEFYDLEDEKMKALLKSIDYKEDQDLPQEALEDENDESEEEEEEEEGDPMNLNDDQIMDYGDLEDLQEVPVDVNEVGKMRNLIMVERGGEYYPVINKNQKTVEIPHVSGGNPFGDSDSEEEPEVDRYADGTDDYNPVGLPNFSDDNEEEWSDVEGTNVFEGPDYEPDGDQRHGLGDAIEEGGEGEFLEPNDYANVDVDEDELLRDKPVCHGDEHDAESTALAQYNDGVKVKNVGVRPFVSLAEYANFAMRDRVGMPSRFQGDAGNLGQLWTCDQSVKVKEMRMKALTTKRAIFPHAVDRNTLFEMYQKMLQKGFNGEKKLGCLCTLPSTVPGTSKYQRELVMSAVTMANRLGHPHLFITFTGNPKWPEIEEEIKKRKCTWADIPDFVDRVFKCRFEIFLEDVLGKAKKSRKNSGKIIREAGHFGAIKWYNFSIEFQQRGMPHCHLLIALETPISDAAQVDEIIQAEVPEKPDPSDIEYEGKLRYWTLVKDLMVHCPCHNVPLAYCNQDKKPYWTRCCKGFPKRLCDNTILSDNQYPDYKRNSGRHYEVFRNGQRLKAGDEYVVSHNRELLMRHTCHMNIEVVSSIKTMKYMYKYIHKGSDRVLLEATEKVSAGSFASDRMTLRRNVFAPKNLNLAKVRERQAEADRLMLQAGVTIGANTRVALNDCSYTMDMSAITACEAAWRLAGFPMHGSSHIVHRGYVHEENKDVMFLVRGVGAAQAGQMLKQKSKGMMVAWFEANENPILLKDGRMTTDLTFPEMFSHYKFDPKEQKFKERKNDYSGRIMGRIQAPQPKYLELTATRLLAQTVKGPKSWTELRTFRGFPYATCLQAARARGLMDGDVEWENAIEEVAQTESPIECRRFFVSILVHCAPANPGELWENHWKVLVNNTIGWSDEQKKAHALRHIRFLLARHGMMLNDFELENVFREQDLPAIDRDTDVDNPNIQRMDRNAHRIEGDRLYNQLNQGQKNFVDRVIQLADQRTKDVDRQRLVFVDGPGGTGKTFCYQTIYHLLAAMGKKAICVSHTGIAACLLPNGCTSHRKFSIPLEITPQMVCKVSFGSAEADILAEIDCVIWDEISMTDWRIIHAVNIFFQQLRDSTLPFGGVLIVMGGDWRQILPIVENVRGQAVTDYTLKTYALWDQFEKFKLTENRRAITDPDYAARILKIGDGVDYQDEARRMVFIPERFVERTSDLALADWVFPDVNNIDETKSAALLTLDNRTSLRLNEIILDKLNGEVREFLAVDTPDKDNALNVDPAIFTSETPSGMPPHRLRLKIGAQVVLLRNISVEQGLCNGTRLTITKFGDDIIHCTANNPTENTPLTVFLHRMLLTPSGNGAKNPGFKRLQYPLRLAYACTINKSQGQTLSRCGLVLHSPVFSHGQLYVAMSRVQRGADFKMWHAKRLHRPADDYHYMGGILVRNVVFHQVLRDRPVEEILERLEPNVAQNDNNDSDSEHSSLGQFDALVNHIKCEVPVDVKKRSGKRRLFTRFVDYVRDFMRSLRKRMNEQKEEKEKGDKNDERRKEGDGEEQEESKQNVESDDNFYVEDYFHYDYKRKYRKNDDDSGKRDDIAQDIKKDVKSERKNDVDSDGNFYVDDYFHYDYNRKYRKNDDDSSKIFPVVDLRNAPRFSDHSKTSFAIFVRSFEDFALAHYLDENAAKKLLPFLVTGMARGAYDELSEEEKADTYKNMLMKWNRLVDSPWRTFDAREDLKIVLQENSETVYEFFLRCKDLAGIAYPGQKSHRDRMLKDHFINGLKPHLKEPSFEPTFVNGASCEEIVSEAETRERKNMVQMRKQKVDLDRDFYVEDYFHYDYKRKYK